MNIYEDNNYIKIVCEYIEVTLLKTINGELYDIGDIRIIGNASVPLIQSVISYIHSKYPVTTLRFKDTCVKDGDIMCLFNYLTLGNSWYEDNFGKSTDDMCIFFYDELNKRLLEKKNNTSWEDFLNIMWIHNLSIPLDDIKELYIKASSWQVFFRSLRQRIKSEEFSECINRFIRIYIGNYHAFEYCIPVRPYPR